MEYVYKSTTGKTVVIENRVVTVEPGLFSRVQIEELDEYIGISLNRYDNGVLNTAEKQGAKWDSVTAGELKLCAYTWAEVQTKHDQLVAAGGGELHFVPNATYVVPLGGKVNIDSSYVSLKFNHAKIDISAYCPNVGTGFLGDFGVIFYIYSSALVHDYSRHQVCRTIEDGHIVGNTDIYINWSLRTSITGVCELLVPIRGLLIGRAHTLYALWRIARFLAVVRASTVKMAPLTTLRSRYLTTTVLQRTGLVSILLTVT